MNLREWLFKQRLSITFFAALMKVDRSYVHRWMKGDNIPSEEVMKRVREISLDEVYNPEDLKDIKISRKLKRDVKEKI